MLLMCRDSPDVNDLRSRTITLFFTHLQGPSPEVIQVAKRGLQIVIQHGKMPRGLLQVSLKPILVNLAMHHKLSKPLLVGLAHFLELVANSFNVTLGTSFLKVLHMSIPMIGFATVTFTLCMAHICVLFSLKSRLPGPA